MATQQQVRRRSALDVYLFGPLRVVFYSTLYFVFGLFANTVFLLSIFVWPVAPGLAYEINSRVAYTLWSLMQRVFEKEKGAVVSFSGDGVPDGENAIVIANHASYSDFYLVNALALRKGMLPYCRWFAKADLMWQLPVFGLSMWLIGMVMVKRDWLKDAASTREAFLDLKRPEPNGKKVWLVTFLEGTRKTDKKLALSQKFSGEKGKPVLKNLLFPRTKGFVAAVKELRGSQVTHVYDLTLLYSSPPPNPFGTPASLWQVHSLPSLTDAFHYHLHVRRWAISSLPESDDELAKWVEDRWVEKDAIIEGVKRDIEDRRRARGAGVGEGVGERIGWEGLVGKAGGSGDQGSHAYGVYRDDVWSRI